MLRVIDGLTSLMIVIEFNFIRNWKIIFVQFIIQSGILFLLLWIVPSSPIFYLSKGKFDRSRRIYEQIARFSKVQMFEERLQGENDDDDDDNNNQELGEQQFNNNDQNNNQQQQQGFRDICKAGKVAIHPLIIFCILWLVGELIYYGINFGVKDFEGDIFINSLIVFGAEIIGYIGSGKLADSIGRKMTFFISFCMIVVFGIAYTLFTHVGGQIQVGGYISLLFVKLGASGVINMDYLLLAQLFPTSVRGSVMGITNFFARLGCILAPFGQQFLGSWCLIMYACLAAVCAVLVMKLDETKGMQMRLKLDDMKVQQKLRNEDDDIMQQNELQLKKM